MSFGFGIVGCGAIANFHAKAIRDLRSTRLVGCFSRSVASCERFAKAHACCMFATLNELVQAPEIDVVCVCTPSGVHLEPALAALQSGKHVLVEKPLEVTLSRCDRILRAAEKHNVLVSTIFQSRFHAAIQQIKRALERGRFGRITLADAYVKWHRPQSYYDSAEWRGTWKLDGGGALMNQAIHSVDLLLWLIGPASSVTAHTATLAHERIEVEDTLAATIQFENGALGVIEASTSVYPGSLKRLEIRGTKGTVIVEEEHLLEWTFSTTTRRDAEIRKRFMRPTTTGGGASDPKAIGHHGHAAQIRDFLQAVRKGTNPMVDGPQARASVELILAIYSAARSGRRVSLMRVR